MFSYEKMLQYPVNIKNPNPKYAQIVLEQYGGPDGELGASLRYLSQRFSMPYPELKGLLTDIGTEELGHRDSPVPIPCLSASFLIFTIYSITKQRGYANASNGRVR